jgi:ribosome-binding protein aMBF1 (putative translation factor)
VRSSKSVPPSKRATQTAIVAERQPLSNNFTQAPASFSNANPKAATPRPRNKQGSLLKQFGRNLRELRLERDLSQKQLASKARMSSSVISICERGKRSITLREVYLLSLALNIQVARLCRDM